MKIQIRNAGGKHMVAINGHLVSGIESFQLEALMNHWTGVHFVVHSAELEVAIANEDIDVIVTNSTEDIASYVRTLNPKMIENKALRNLGSMDGGFTSLAEAIIHLIADDLTETGDETATDEGERVDLGLDGGRGLIDPPSFG